jgi:outer membrane protein TolC
MNRRRRTQWVGIALAAVVSRGAQARAATSLTPGPVLTWAAVQDQLRHLEAGPRHYPGPPLTLKDAIDEVLSVNPELVALRKQVDAMRFRPAQERFLAPPMAEAQVWQWPLNTLNPINTNMYMFMVTQELPGRGKRALRAAVAEKDVALAEAEIAIRARQIVDSVKMAYADLFVSRKAIDIHLASVDLLRQLADISQIKYTTGRISQQDVLKSVVEISRLHDDLIKFDQQADLARARLNILLDRSPDAPIGALIDPYERVLVPAVEDLQRVALELQPELQSTRVQVEKAQAELAVAERDYKPDFSIMGGYMLQPNQTDAWLGKVAITWPRAPWSRGRIDARVAEATAALETAKARQRAMENAVRLAVQDAYVRVKAAEQRAALLRTTILPQSRQTLEVARVAYQTDRVDFLALLDNERTLLDAQLEYFRAVSDVDQALADLERALGTDIVPWMVTPVATGEVK